jgi:hypothetical protein
MVDDRPHGRDGAPACDGCDGSGLRDPATPSCALHVPAGWHVLERCDACGQFPSDLAAARHRHDDRFQVVRSGDDGEHVLAPDPAGAS